MTGEGFLTRWKLAFAAVMMVAVLAGCAASATRASGESEQENGDKATQTEVSVVLTERQKEILEQGGLPTEYEELTIRQKSAIVKIEKMLVYLEDKYGKEFAYAGYVPGELMDEEHLLAYPADDPESQVITVWRNEEDGEEDAFEDDYPCILATPWYQAAAEAYFAKTFVPETFLVYAEVTETEEDVTEETILRKASAKLYVLLDEQTCTKQQLDDFAAGYGAWMQEQSDSCQSSSTAMYLASRELMNETDSDNYENVIMAGETSGHVICSIHADGRINIF